MRQAEDTSKAREVARLLESAAKVVSGVRYCWLVTHARNGDANARPMGRVRPNADEKDWIIRFVTDGRSRKVAEIRLSGKIKLAFQNDDDDAFILVSGTARLLEGKSAFRQHWKDSYGMYFPRRKDRANAAFIELVAQRMDLWIRGVTSEPFGLRPTVLERDQGGRWHVLSEVRAAVAGRKPAGRGTTIRPVGSRRCLRLS